MNEIINDFARLNAQIVAELPDWKKQYDLRVSSYSPAPSETAPQTRIEGPVAELFQEDS